MMGSRLAVRPLDVTLSVGLMGCVIWSGFDRMKHGRIEGERGGADSRRRGLEDGRGAEGDNLLSVRPGASGVPAKSGPSFRQLKTGVR